MSAPKQLTQLPALAGFDGTELLYLVQSMVHGRITLDELKAYLDEFPDRLAANVAQTDADLNTIVESGWYRLGATNANAPAHSWSHSLMLVSRGGTSVSQQVIHFATNTVWVRAGNPPEVGGAGSWQPWSQVARLDAPNTWTGSQRFSGQFPSTVSWDDDGAAAGPYSYIRRGRTSAAANDFLGALGFLGQNSAGAGVTYAWMLTQIVSAAAGAHSGKLLLRTTQNGLDGNRAVIEEGLTVGSPTGGDRGAGTINLEHAPYVQGAALASSHLAGFARGTWVPALSGGTVAGDIVHAVQEGYYITDGEWVKAFFNIEAYIGAGTAPSGNLLVSLPFTTAEAAWVSAGVVNRASNATVGQHFTGWGVRRHSATAGIFTVQNGNSGSINNADAPTVLSSSSGSPTLLQGCIEYIR